MITEIGIVAGEIWNFLDKQGEVSLEKLIAGIERPRELTLMSLGWLAREGHVLVGRDEGRYKINLREDNVKSCMKKGVVLIVIIGVMAVIFALALAALHLMTQESRITEHKIKRTRAFFAAQAGMVLAQEQLRSGVWSGTNPGRNYCLNDDIGNDCTPPRTIPDASIPYDVTMTIYSPGSTFASAPIAGTSQIDIQVDY